MKRSNLYAGKQDFASKKNGYFASFYIKVLDDNFLEIYQSDLVFMNDNASIYTVKKIFLWWNKNDINIINWSLYSSDINLIEHLWFFFKEKVYDYNVCSDMKKADRDNEKIKETLFKTLFKIWEQLNTYYLHDLI